MSTIFFGPHALGNVLACVRCAGIGETTLRKAAEGLAAYSVANCKAFRAEYKGRHGSDLARPWTASEILRFVDDDPDYADAKSFLDLGCYNLDDFETPELAKFLRSLRNMIPRLSLN